MQRIISICGLLRRGLALVLIYIAVWGLCATTIYHSARASPNVTADFLLTTKQEVCYMDSNGFNLVSIPLVGISGFVRGIAVACSDTTFWIVSSAPDVITHIAADGSALESFPLVYSVGAPTDLALDDTTVWVCTEAAMVYEHSIDDSLWGLPLRSFSTVSCGIPAGIALDPASSSLWILDEIGNLCEFTMDGLLLQQQFCVGHICPNPSGLDMDSEAGVFWVADEGQNAVCLIDTLGQSLQTISVVGCFGLTGVAIYYPCPDTTGVGQDHGALEHPVTFSLAQNCPNPFNPITQIKYALPKDCKVKLTIYNVLGQKVASLIDGRQKAGYKVARWDASSFSSGIYFYRLQAGDFVQTRRMILLK